MPRAFDPDKAPTRRPRAARQGHLREAADGCTKRHFRSEELALRALDSIRAQGLPRPRQEKRAYQCPSCFYWHLTSAP